MAIKDKTPQIYFYTVDQIGEKRSFTPEGFLLCEDVPVARTGEMMYHASELMDGGKSLIEPDQNGFIRISRDEAEVFNPEYLASFAGKPLTNDHPDEDVNPNNFRYLSVGTVLNPRRGDGEQRRDLVICDLMVTDERAINDILENDKREVSVGYSADYLETAPGEGKQVNMIVNHVALVDSGRCGPRCAIGDSKFKKGDTQMAKQDKAKWYDKLKHALKSKDAEALGEAIKEIHDDELPETAEEQKGGDEHHIHLNMNHPGEKSRFSDEDHDEFRRQNAEEHAEMRARIEALEKMLEEKKTQDDDGEEKEEDLTEDEQGMEEELSEEAAGGNKTHDKSFIRSLKDSSHLAASYQATVAGAEILVPGIRIPEFDKKSDPRKTFTDCICSLRRNALDLAYATPEGRGVIGDLLGGKSFDAKNMKCRDVTGLFRGAVAAKKALNNASRTNDISHLTAAGTGVKSKVKTIAELNELHRKHFDCKA